MKSQIRFSFLVIMAILLQSCGPQFKAPIMDSIEDEVEFGIPPTSTTVPDHTSTTTTTLPSTTTSVPGGGNPHDPDPNVKLVLSVSALSQNQLSLKVHDSRDLQVKTEHLMSTAYRLDSLQNLSFEVAGEIDGDRWLDFAIFRSDYTSTPEQTFVKLISSKTSQVLFERQGSRTQGQIRHMAIGPDLNGDGFNEIILSEDYRIKAYSPLNSQTSLVNIVPGCSMAEFFTAKFAFVDANQDGLKDLFMVCAQYDSNTATMKYRARIIDLKVSTPEGQRLLVDFPLYQTPGSSTVFELYASSSAVYIAAKEIVPEGTDNLYRQIKVLKLDRFSPQAGSTLYTAQMSTIFDYLSESQVEIAQVLFDNVDSTESPEMYFRISRLSPQVSEIKFVSLEPETVWSVSLQTLRTLLVNFNPFYIWNWPDRPMTVPDTDGDQKKELIYTIGGFDSQGSPAVRFIKHSGMNTDLSAQTTSQSLKFYLGIQ